jgi:TRAP-type transport system small permease protein
VNQVMTLLRSVAAAIGAAAGAVAGLAFLALFVVNMAQIIRRTFFEGGWIWVTDFSQLVFLWMVMLGTVAAYHARAHIVVDFLVAKLSGVSELAVATLVRGIELALFGYLLVGGLDVARNRGGIAYIQLGVPTSWGFYALPVAAALLIVIALSLPLRFEREQALDDIVVPGDAGVHGLGDDRGSDVDPGHDDPGPTGPDPRDR